MRIIENTHWTVLLLTSYIWHFSFNLQSLCHFLMCLEKYCQAIYHRFNFMLLPYNQICFYIIRESFFLLFCNKMFMFLSTPVFFYYRMTIHTIKHIACSSAFWYSTTSGCWALLLDEWSLCSLHIKVNKQKFSIVSDTYILNGSIWVTFLSVIGQMLERVKQVGTGKSPVMHANT